MWAFSISSILTGSIVVLIETFDRAALGLFLPADSNALHIALHLNRIGAWSFVFFGISIVLFGVVRANGAVMAPLLILVFALLGVRFPLALILRERWHADAIWWSFPLSSLVAVLLAIAYYKLGHWKRARMITPAPGAGTGASSVAATQEISPG